MTRFFVDVERCNILKNDLLIVLPIGNRHGDNMYNMLLHIVDQLTRLI